MPEKKKVKDILSQLFNKASIDYIQLEKQLILKPKVAAQEAPEIKVDKPEKFTISGHLKDSETGEALIGATIAIKGTSIGTITNNYGFYSLSLPKGNYLLQFSYIGYESKLEEIQLNKNQKLSQTLKLDETDLEVIVISATENDDLHTVNPLKKINLRPLEHNLKKESPEKWIFFNQFSLFLVLIQQVMVLYSFSHVEAIKIKT
ncbi:MAG: carboxypeptidase-like regulatory domain-containing protein [Chloroflexia bacterium]|nr:carboxypeptidase-like regulatory domain-containing protein [Chloroflexia bacterium]